MSHPVPQAVAACQEGCTRWGTGRGRRMEVCQSGKKFLKRNYTFIDNYKLIYFRHWWHDREFTVTQLIRFKLIKYLPLSLLSHQVEVGCVVCLPFRLVSIQVTPAYIICQYYDEIGLLTGLSDTGAMLGHRVEQQTTHQHPREKKQGESVCHFGSRSTEDEVNIVFLDQRYNSPHKTYFCKQSILFKIWKHNFSLVWTKTGVICNEMFQKNTLEKCWQSNPSTQPKKSLRIIYLNAM